MASSIYAFEKPPAETLRVPVIRVFDGDGFLTEIRPPTLGSAKEVTVRFGFIDAPEMEQPGGHEAKAFLSSIIAEKWVDLVILTKMDTGGIVDRHGRIVCVPYITTERPSETNKPQESLANHLVSRLISPLVTRNVELEMVLNGWAWVLERYGPDECYLDALADARRHRRGIWAYDNNVHPWEFKKQKYRSKQAGKRTPPTPDLFSHEQATTPCPQPGCNGVIVRKDGKFGPFLGCSNFPRCRHTSGL